MEVCAICRIPKEYISPYYKHSWNGAALTPGTHCVPPAPYGKRICWRCGRNEQNIESGKLRSHDFAGDGQGTCVKVVTQKCNVCQQYKQYASPHYLHSFPDGMYPNVYNCKPPQQDFQHNCWNCGLSEQIINAKDSDNIKHDFMGYGSFTCKKTYTCDNCGATVYSEDEHESDGGGSGMGVSYWRCGPKKSTEYC
jgi:hypothetical protein